MFKVGQKVVCIHGSKLGLTQKGHIYTVAEIQNKKFRDCYTKKIRRCTAVLCQEKETIGFDEWGMRIWHELTRFRPLDWAEEALERAREAAEKEPELYTLKEVACHEQ